MICYHFALSVLLSCSRSPLLERYSSHLCAFPSQRYEVQYQGMVSSLILLSLRNNVQWSLDRQTWDLAEMPQGFVAVQLDQPLELEASMWITCGISLLSQHSTQYAAEKLKPATPDSVGIGIDDMSGDPLNVWQQALVDDDCTDPCVVPSIIDLLCKDLISPTKIHHLMRDSWTL